MAHERITTPDALVLGAGGVLGEAWMSALLAGLDEGRAFASRECSLYLGTSAGSIVAAALVAGLAPDARLGVLPAAALEPDRRSGGPGLLGRTASIATGLAGAVAAPLAPLAFSTGAHGGALLRRMALARIPEGRHTLRGLADAVERSGMGWDGRLRVAAVDLESGRRVVFGDPGAPQVPVAIAVEASCSIPGVFRPVRAGGRIYVDGGAWSPTNLDAIQVGRGDSVLCLNPTASIRAGAGAALGPISRAAAGAEALVLRRRGASVRTISPDEQSAAALGPDLMNPSRRRAVIAAGLRQGRMLAAGAALGTRAA
jgi:NTE family protein